MPQLACAGYKTWFYEYGQGDAPALLLHCSLALGRVWSGMADCLADRLRMIAMDLPGHGQSADWDKPRDMLEQTTVMAAELLAHDVSRKGALGVCGAGYHVIGHSYGAVAALRLALDHPGKVASLTLIEPVFFYAACQVDPLFAQGDAKATPDYITAIRSGDMTRAAQQFLRVWGSGVPLKDMAPQQAQYMIDRMPLVLAQQPALADDSGDLWPRLSGLNCPVLLLEGTLSPPVISRIQAALCDHIPRARRGLIDGAGHMLPLSHAKPVAMQIAGFITSLSCPTDQPDHRR